MAINKVVNKSTKSHGAMRNVLEYVLRDEKVKEGYVEIAGPYSGETINYDEVYQKINEANKNCGDFLMWIGNPLGVFLVIAIYVLAIFISIFSGGRR